MKKFTLTLVGSCILAQTAFCEQLTVSINPLADPTGFNITAGSQLSLRVAEEVPATPSNASTHILIEGLSPIEPGSSYYASNYQGINSANGEEQDLGVLLLELPEGSGLPDGTVSSPIVGVVERSGAWNGYGLTIPSTSIGGASGSSGFTSDGDTIDATLVRGPDTFTGSIPYTVIDTDTIELDAFTLTGPTTINLSGTTMIRDGNRFYGTVTNLSDGAAYDSLLFFLEFSGIPDADSDGIPDISDGTVNSGGGLIVGEWQRLELSWVYGYTSAWGLSTYMSYIWVPFYPYVYQVNVGWLYLSSTSNTNHLLYNWNRGWLLADEGNGGWYYIYATDSWANFINP